MKLHSITLCLVILALFLPGIQAQKFTVGAGTGVNFSDIHGATSSGSWKPKPGPSAGLFVRWSMTPALGLQTGLDYATVYYEHHSYITNPGPILYPSYSSYFQPYPDIIMIPQLQTSNHSLITFPLQLTVTIPAQPRLTIGAGMFLSAVLDQDFNLSYAYEEAGKKSDYGYIFSLDIDYPFTDRLGLLVRARYLTGRHRLGNGWDYKHGWSDLIAGLSLDLGRNMPDAGGEHPADEALNQDLSLSWYTGVAVSWNSGNVIKDEYSVYTGPSAGFLLGRRLGASKTRFSTGLILERTGYSLRDSSDFYYRLDVRNNADYLVDTRTSSDYAVIPVLLGFSMGEKERVSIAIGPWFAARLNSQCRGTAWNEYETDTYFQRREIIVNDDITEQTRRNDFGWMVRAAAAIPVRGDAVFNLGINFRQGIPEVLSHERAGTEDADTDGQIFIRNSVLTLNAGLTVPVRMRAR